MKVKLFIAGVACMMLGLCANKTYAQKKKAVTKKAVSVAKVAPKPFATQQEIEEGEALISKSDCLTCHKLDDKLVGPSYTAIAQKYPQNQATIAALSDKVIKGGSGVWGPVPMTPHPTLAATDINKMVAYVLSLKK